MTNSTSLHRLRTATLSALAVLLILASSAVAQRGSLGSPAAVDVQRALGLQGGQIVSLTVDPTPARAILLPLNIDSAELLLALTPYSVRGSDYRVLVEDADGAYGQARPTTGRTLRGELLGIPGSAAAASLLDDGLHARVQLPDGRDLWLEPLVGRVRGAAASHYVLYRGEDVLDQGVVCGTSVLPDARLHSAELTGLPAGTSAATGLKVAQLACDADYEYYSDWGSVAAVENRIQAVVNSMNLQYERDVGITHEITTIIVRSSPSQPYTSTDANTLLNQFRNQWNAFHGNITRDVAHLFTGKSVDGSTIGIAWIGVVCNLSYGYGLVESDFNNNFAYATDLSAHELGHNWGASHCTCTSYTMNPYITGANAFNPSGTIPTITNFKSASTCLTDGGGDPPPPPPPPEPGVNLATADLGTAEGLITAGSYQSTHQSDNTYEALTEGQTGGKPKNRKSLLQHTWSFSVQAGSNYTFSVEAHHQANSEGDHFRFSYSRDQVSWTPMLTVTKTADNDTPQAYAFTGDVAGALYVRADDTDATPGKSSLETLYVDRMFVMTTVGGPDTTPPSAPTALVATAGNGSVALDWNDVVDANLAGYTVRRSTVSGGPYGPVTASLIGTSAYVDTSVSNGTTYYYVVTATDASGNTSGASNQAAATPNVPGAGPTTMHVAQITVTTVNVTAGYKQGQAQVRVVDDQGGAVAGATVTGTFSGGLSQTVSASTNASGVATLGTTATAKGSFPLTFCVDVLVHGSLVHTPSADVVTCGSK